MQKKKHLTSKDIDDNEYWGKFDETLVELLIYILYCMSRESRHLEPRSVLNHIKMLVLRESRSLETLTLPNRT